MRIAAAAFGPATAGDWDSPERAVDFFDVKGDLEAVCAPLALRFEPGEHPALHPGRSARVRVGSEAVGWIGELHPRWLRKYELPQAPVLFELDADPLLTLPSPRPRVPSRFPPVVRDMALVVPRKPRFRGFWTPFRPKNPPSCRRSVCSAFTGVRGSLLAEKALRSG